VISVKNDNRDMFCINPVNQYSAPEIPTLADVKCNPTILKKLPARWKKNAKVLACAAVIGMGVLPLAGCTDLLDEVHHLHNRVHNGGDGGAPIYVTQRTEQEIQAWAFGDSNLDPSITNEMIQEALNAVSAIVPQEELLLRSHFGGSAAGPFYVVHMTEQEALGIIHAQLEAVGLSFDDIPPEYVVTFTDDWYERSWDVGLDLFDADKGVALLHARSQWEASGAANRFAEQTSESAISIGAFFNPEVSPDHEFATRWDEVWDEDGTLFEPSGEELADIKERVRPILEENLTRQAQGFIAWLRENGILD